MELFERKASELNVWPSSEYLWVKMGEDLGVILTSLAPCQPLLLSNFERLWTDSHEKT
jgi:hypothetical protein